MITFLADNVPNQLNPESSYKLHLSSELFAKKTIKSQNFPNSRLKLPICSPDLDMLSHNFYQTIFLDKTGPAYLIIYHNTRSAREVGNLSRLHILFSFVPESYQHKNTGGPIRNISSVVPILFAVNMYCSQAPVLGHICHLLPLTWSNNVIFIFLCQA